MNQCCQLHQDLSVQLAKNISVVREYKLSLRSEGDYIATIFCKKTFSSKKDVKENKNGEFLDLFSSLLNNFSTAAWFS